jgi:hypothetical protein
MTADFGEPGAVEDDDQVRHPHRAEAMRPSGLLVSSGVSRNSGGWKVVDP